MSGLRMRSSNTSEPLEIDHDRNEPQGPHQLFPTRYIRSKKRNRTRWSLEKVQKLIAVTCCIIIIVFALLVGWTSFAQALERYYWNNASPRWTIWDHNIYPQHHTSPINISKQHDEKKQRQRNALIVQQATLMNTAQILEVTSRVNRAYAKSWGYDYARLDGASVDAARVLDKILEVNVRAKSSGYSPNVADSKTYDVVLVLDPDAMLVDLDIDVLDMFAPGFLVGSIAKSAENDESMLELNDGLGIMFWNLNHAEIRPLSKLWREQMRALRESNLVVDDGAVLADILSNTYSPRELRALVQSLGPPEVNYFAGSAVKFFRKPQGLGMQSKSDWFNSEWEDIIPVLDQTATAVCFKYYPKCDVV